MCSPARKRKERRARKQTREQCENRAENRAWLKGRGVHIIPPGAPIQPKGMKDVTPRPQVTFEIRDN